MTMSTPPRVRSTRRHGVRVSPHVRQQQRGVVLIEGLIAILIFSIAVLGLVGLQVSMSRAQSSAKYRIDASNLAADLVGTIWADSGKRTSYDTAGCPGHPPCKAWSDRLKATLPASSYDIVFDSATGDFNITLRWSVPNEGAHQFVTSTTINPNL